MIYIIIYNFISDLIYREIKTLFTNYKLFLHYLKINTNIYRRRCMLKMHDKLIFSQIIFQISKCLTSLTHPVPTIIGSPLPENPVLTQIDTTVWLTSTLGRDGYARIQYGWKRVSDKNPESLMNVWILNDFFFIKFKIDMIYTCIKKQFRDYINNLNNLPCK